MCNLYFKWKYMLDEADRLECDYIATGHYARITQNMNRYILEKGLDPKKDQSYFLWRLGQKELSRTLFPLGNITKEEIKTYVLQKGFKEKVEKKEEYKMIFYSTKKRNRLFSICCVFRESLKIEFPFKRSSLKILFIRYIRQILSIFFCL